MMQSAAGSWPVVIHLAHPGGPDHPQGVEPAICQHFPDLLWRGMDDAHRPAHDGLLPMGHGANTFPRVRADASRCRTMGLVAGPAWVEVRVTGHRGGCL